MPRGECDRDRESEGRRRQDDDRDQPRGRPRRARLPRAVHRHGPAGEPDGRASASTSARSSDRWPTCSPMAARRIDEIIIPTQTTGIDVAPATLDLAVDRGRAVHAPSAASRRCARRSTGWLDDRYDFALIDCPPTLGLLTDQRPRRREQRDHPGPDAVLRAEGPHRPGQGHQHDPRQAQSRPADPRPAADVLRRPHDPRPRHARRAARASATITSSTASSATPSSSARLRWPAGRSRRTPARRKRRAPTASSHGR